MGTEGRLERSRQADRWPTGESLAAMLDGQQAAFVAVRNALPQLTVAVQAAARQLGEAGRLIYAGAGASGRIAVQDGVELWPTFGWPNERLLYLIAGGEAALTRSREGAEDDGEGARALIREHAGDPGVVIRRVYQPRGEVHPRHRVSLPEASQASRHVIRQCRAGSEKQRHQAGFALGKNVEVRRQRRLQEPCRLPIQFGRRHIAGMEQRHGLHGASHVFA